jgi:hypothetical protein
MPTWALSAFDNKDGRAAADIGRYLSIYRSLDQKLDHRGQLLRIDRLLRARACIGRSLAI